MSFCPSLRWTGREFTGVCTRGSDKGHAACIPHVPEVAQMTVEVQTCFTDLIVPLLPPLLGLGARCCLVDGFLHLCYFLQPHHHSRRWLPAPRPRQNPALKEAEPRFHMCLSPGASDSSLLLYQAGGIALTIPQCRPGVLGNGAALVLIFPLPSIPVGEAAITKQ